MDNELLVSILRKGVEIVDDALPSRDVNANLRGVAYARVLDALIRNARLHPPQYPTPEAPDHSADMGVHFAEVIYNGENQNVSVSVAENDPLTVQKIIVGLGEQLQLPVPDEWQIRTYGGMVLPRHAFLTPGDLPLYMDPRK